MARKIIDTGTEGNTATGDTLRTAMTKINTNFDELYTDLAGTTSSGGILINPTTNGDTRIIANGTGIVEINASGIDVTGISTSTSVSTGSVNSSGVVTASDFNSTSDRELKENITTVDDAVNLTQQLRGVRFEWKKDGTPAYGVIAQELEEVLPELVSQTNPKTVNYNGLIGVLIEAVKELSSEVAELKRQIQN